MSIGTVGVIGAGQMGAGVAQVAAQAGVKVLLNDISGKALYIGLYLWLLHATVTSFKVSI